MAGPWAAAGSALDGHAGRSLSCDGCSAGAGRIPAAPLGRPPPVGGAGAHRCYAPRPGLGEREAATSGSREVRAGIGGTAASRAMAGSGALAGLEENGFPVVAHIRPGLGHSIDEAGIGIGARFLADRLGPVAAGGAGG